MTTENTAPASLVDTLGFLPESLHVEQIATFEKSNLPARIHYIRTLVDACDSRELLCARHQQYDDWWINGFPDEWKWWYLHLELCEGPSPSIRRDDYREWLTRKGLPLPAWWFGDSQAMSDVALGAQRREPFQTPTTPPADNRRSEEQRAFANLQHAERNSWYASKVAEARDKWKKGSTLRHEQMVDNLMEDAPRGISKKTLLGRLANLLRDDLNRPDLIRGNKK